MEQYSSHLEIIYHQEISHTLYCYPNCYHWVITTWTWLGRLHYIPAGIQPFNAIIIKISLIPRPTFWASVLWVIEATIGLHSINMFTMLIAIFTRELKRRTCTRRWIIWIHSYIINIAAASAYLEVTCPLWAD